MALLRLPSLLLISGLCMASTTTAFAAPDASSSTDFLSGSAGTSSTTSDQTTRAKGEQLTVHGRRNLPPGYQDAPTGDISHGPDPDHAANVHRDAVTGSDLSHFGTAYQNGGPYGTGQLGDATGNGWVTPR